MNDINTNIFFTAVNPKIQNEKIHYNDSIISLGSCFASNIVETMSKHWLKVQDNPIGIAYNPLSIASQIDMTLNHKNFEFNSFKQNDLWCDFRFHGSFCSYDKNQLESNIKQNLIKLNSNLKTAKVLIITFGTSFGYFKKTKNTIVNNCHKLSANNFIRRLISIEESFIELSKSLDKLHDYNPSLEIILTLSPIRHLRDDAEENSLSKATLRCLINKLIQHSSNKIHYFPAYEIMLDELRDYRFYNEDMCHPSPQAINYITNKFIKNYASPELIDYIAKATKIRKELEHKPINTDSLQHQTFIKKTNKKLALLQQEYPELNITN